MKKMLWVVLGCVCGVAAAATNTTAEARANFKVNFQKKYYENTGGRVVKPNSGEGKIVVFNSQAKVGASTVASILENLTKTLSIKLDFQRGDKPSVDQLDSLAKKSGGAATLFVVDDPILPMSLVAYENGWGLVNMSKFTNADPVVQASRLEREIARTIALTCGIAYGMGTSTLMMPIRTSEALDNVELPNERGNPMITGPIHKYMLNFGLTPVTVTTYRKACVEGWAPAPTNDVQKVLWSKARNEKERGPTNAIRILPKKK